MKKIIRVALIASTLVFLTACCGTSYTDYSCINCNNDNCCGTNSLTGSWY